MKYTKENVIGLVFTSLSTNYTVSRINAESIYLLRPNETKEFCAGLNTTQILNNLNSGEYKIVKEPNTYEIY